MYLYLSALFVLVLMFMLLSYFTSQRNTTEINSLHEKNTAAQQRIENLQTNNMQLQDENKTYKDKINELEGQVSALQQEIDALKQLQADAQSNRQDTAGRAKCRQGKNRGQGERK